MDLIFNELSYQPLANSSFELEERYKQLLKTFKSAKAAYSFRSIRFPVNYGENLVMPNTVFKQWIFQLKNPTLQALILNLCKPPYLDDLDSDELHVFYSSTFEIDDSDVPTNDSPLGLAVSYINGLPAVSFDSDLFWRKGKINVKIFNEYNEHTFPVYNLCLEDLNSPEINEWVENEFINEVKTEDLLKLYLRYTRYDILFTELFSSQLWQWEASDPAIFKRILQLMKDVQLHPFSGGIGRTENLLNRGKEGSKRITGLHRLSYKLENNIVEFLACHGHYDFH